MKKIITLILVISIIISSTLFISCGGDKVTELIGAGASFPLPYYQQMFDEYYRQNRIQINYQSIGSGGGIRELTNKTVDFGATDAYLSDEQLKNIGADVLHIPTCMGAVVVTYNLQNVGNIKLTGDIIADIFMGKITNWNDNKLKSLNPNVNFPNLNITVINRSDSSGTTFVFSDYLTKVSRDWANGPGRGTSLEWPVGVGGRQNDGVSGLVSQTPGSIGYVEFIYAKNNNLPMADVQNKQGNFITPSIESVNIAADVDIPEDTRVTITDTDAAQGYPISTFTWIILYKEQNYGDRSKERAKATIDLLRWVITEGQKFAPPLEYAPLSASAVEKSKALLDSVVYKGEKLE